MSATEPNEFHEPAGGAWFQTTHWSVILAARDNTSAQAGDAMEKLCRAYWTPLYAYIRREGHSPTEAQDLTQEFFARFLAKDYLQHLRHQEGRFRSFLLTFVKHFLSDQRDRANTQKRGGGRTFVSIDGFEAEERAGIEPVDSLTPDQVYERRWAQAVMDRAAATLREEYAAKGKAPLFESIKDLQPGKHGERSYADIGGALGLSEQAVKNAVLAFRRRYSMAVRNEIAQTVSTPGEVEEEIRHLLQVLAG